ncbi:MAG: PDZ domain-containing protein [Chitinophagaceae bacterium]
MKKYVFASFMAAALFSGFISIAQETKEKEKSKMGERDEIIIKKKGDKESKVIVEIKDGEVTINGKSIDEFDDENISVRRRKTPTVNVYSNSRFRSLAPLQGVGESYSGEPFAGFSFSNGNKAFLGVSADEEDGTGAKIISVTPKSAAEKAGLKKGDIITKIETHSIEDRGDLTEAIGNYKPEDKVTITYKRDGKENKVTAILGKNKTTGIARTWNSTEPALGELRTYPGSPDLAPLQGDAFNFQFDSPADNNNHLFGMINGRPRLGIKAQDTEEGKGVKVLDVAEESLAEKAGIKEGDIITEFDGIPPNSADDLADAAQEAKDKPVVKLQINRAGKSQTVEIKTPKKLKTANL